MSDITFLEHATLKVPYEVLNKKFRAAQKSMEKETFHVKTAALQLTRGLAADTVTAGEISRMLGRVLENLEAFKRKADYSTVEELHAVKVCKRRVEHLKEHNISGSSWRKSRLDRMLVDYFLQQGNYSVAQRLAHTSGLGDITNVDIFTVARDIEHSLKNRETSKCLDWCDSNRSKLSELKSSLEFNIRKQEFVELVRSKRLVDAVHHARRYLSTCEPEQLPEVQHCMALLAFPSPADESPYRALLDDSRWERLKEQFRRDHRRILQPEPRCMFSAVLQAGLSAMKTPECYMQHHESCPVCQKQLNALAAPLPFAHCSHSRLICRISRLPLNEHNQPMVLPNGQVYGANSLRQMAADNQGKVVCPKTGEVFLFEMVEKVYVM